MLTISIKKKYSLALRLWHWLTAIVIFCLLLTVFFRNVFFSSFYNAGIIRSELQNSKIVISEELAVKIAKSIRQPFWEWHYYFGFTLGVLALFRAGIFFFQTKNSSNSLKKDWQLSSLNYLIQGNAGYYPIVRRVYALYYFIVMIIILTGLSLYFKNELHFSKKISGVIKTVHESAMWGIIIFIVIHIAGVLWEEKKYKDKGVVSAMINGGK